jgi:hypothetical protein
MPVPSNYPNFKIPEVDLWEFLFEREDRRFPDEKSMSPNVPATKYLSKYILMLHTFSPVSRC